MEPNQDLRIELAGLDRTGQHIIMAHPYDVAIVRDYCGPNVIGKDLAEALVDRFNQHPKLIQKVSDLVDRLFRAENELMTMRAQAGRSKCMKPGVQGEQDKSS